MNARPLVALANLSKKRVLAGFIAVLLLAASGARATEPARGGTGQGQVTLAWNPTIGAAGYLFYNSSDGVNFDSPIDVGPNLTVALSGLQAGTTNYFYVAAYDANHVVGTASTVISYLVPGGMVITPKTSARTATALRFSAIPGRTYAVQASADLANWTTLWETTAASNQWVNYQDPMGATLQMRFYRVASLDAAVPVSDPPATSSYHSAPSGKLGAESQ